MKKLLLCLFFIFLISGCFKQNSLPHEILSKWETGPNGIAEIQVTLFKDKSFLMKSKSVDEQSVQMVNGKWNTVFNHINFESNDFVNKKVSYIIDNSSDQKKIIMDNLYLFQVNSFNSQIQ